MLACGPRACQRGPAAVARLGALALWLAAALLTPSTAPAEPAIAGERPPPVWRVLFLRTSFADVAAERPASAFHRPDGGGLVDRLVAYYAEVSHGRFRIEPFLAERIYRLPKRRRGYVQRPRQLLADAIALAERPEPAGEARLLARARPDAVVVFFAGPGAESDIRGKRRGRLPWSNAVMGGALASIAGRPIERGMVIAEQPFEPLSPFGVLAHEFGHALGLPELYAPGKPHEGIGVWGLMGQGTWLGHGDHPPHLSAWSKLALGWAEVETVERSGRYRLEAVERSGRVLKILAKGPAFPDEYFLIENRERIGADRWLPGQGLLVWHVDDSRTSFRHSQDQARHKRVDLLTADSWPSDLDRGHVAGGNRGDAGDPWADRALGPGPRTRPGTGPYDGTPGRFEIRDISPAGETMSFEIVFTERAPKPRPSGGDGPRLSR